MFASPVNSTIRFKLCLYERLPKTLKIIALSVLSRVILCLMILVNQAIILYCACADALMWSQTQFLFAFANKPSSNAEKNTVRAGK